MEPIRIVCRSSHLRNTFKLLIFPVSPRHRRQRATWLEMYRPQLGDEKPRRQLQRLDKRLLAVASQLERIAQGEE